jgi:hypothetical protein
MATEGTGAFAARDLGRGWKVSPAIDIEPGATVVCADIRGPGAVEHLWMGVNGSARHCVLRCYWDGQEAPSVECPVGDFFACGWGGTEPVSSLPVCMNPKNGFNCYWEMPFARSCRITVENVGPEQIVLYYQVDYSLAAVPNDAGRFHALFRRSNPLGPDACHPVLESGSGKGHLVGLSLAWGAWDSGGARRRSIAFLIDGAGDAPDERCLALEEYFGCSAAFDQPFSTPYAGLVLPECAVGLHDKRARRSLWRSLHRWHIMDPIRFDASLGIVIRAPKGSRDDFASVAYWYQRLPTARFPVFPDRDALEIAGEPSS